MVLTCQEAVEAGAKALRERAVADQRRAGEATDAEWDELLSVSHIIDLETLRIEGAPEIIAAAVLEAVGYADLRQDQIRRDDARRDAILALGDADAEVERLRAQVEKAEARSTFVEEAARTVMGGADKRIRRIEAERDALAATVARVEALAADAPFGYIKYYVHAVLHPENY